MQGIQKIHFINRADFNNVGDYYCSPIYYYWDFFKDFALMRHDIECIDFQSIRRNDVIILGGGGMLNLNDKFNFNIIRLLELCDNVIGWGLGFNEHYSHRFLKKEINDYLGKFILLGIRDYNHPSKVEYVPCVSCKLIELDKAPPSTKRETGVISHKGYRIAKNGLDQVDNSYPIESIVDFILSSKTIITSSYHITYWSQLMGKKVILENVFSSKFDYFEYNPSTSPPESFLERCRLKNDMFFDETKEIILKVIKNTDPSFSKLSLLSNISSQSLAIDKLNYSYKTSVSRYLKEYIKFFLKR